MDEEFKKFNQALKELMQEIYKLLHINDMAKWLTKQLSRGRNG